MTKGGNEEEGGTGSSPDLKQRVASSHPISPSGRKENAQIELRTSEERVGRLRRKRHELGGTVALQYIVLATFFQEEKYANDFVEGRLFANRLSYFKKLEGDERRGDEDEGAIVFQRGNFTLELTVVDEDTGEAQTDRITIGGSDVETSPGNASQLVR